MSRDIERRDFLRLGAAAGAGALLGLGSAPLARAAAAGGSYRALVCVLLSGGNDGFNLLVPTSAPEYAAYAAARQNLAVPLNQLLPIAPATSDGATYGLHPSTAPLQQLFQSGRLALLRNVGTLVAPLTKAEVLGSLAPIPAQLFSHNSQLRAWENVAADQPAVDGWGGAFADHLAGSNGELAGLSAVSLAGNSTLLTGGSGAGYGLSPAGPKALKGFVGPVGPSRQAVFDALRNLPHETPIERTYAATLDQAIALEEVLADVLPQAPSLATQFPANNDLATQLEMVARMISVRQLLGLERQVFFVRLLGFDTHTNQLQLHPLLLGALSAALFAFQSALEELGVAQDVTTCTLSEFGRSLSSNGKGTDHGWGSVQLVLGGSVQGGDLYGTMPDLAPDGPDDLGGGRILPTTAVEQYAATLGAWLGLSGPTLAQTFPNLGNFGAANLGFLG